MIVESKSAGGNFMVNINNNNIFEIIEDNKILIGLADKEKYPEEITISDGITKIGDCVFRNYSSLKKVVIPNSVTYIGTSAFEDCHSLKHVTIPDSVTCICRSAFYDCHSLENIIIPKNTNILGNAFGNCKSL